MQSTGVLNLVIGLTGVKEKHGPTCHISLSPAYSVSFSVFPSRRRAPVRPSSRRRSSTPPQPPVPRRRRRPLHLPPARAAAAHLPRRRTPSPQRIQRRPRAPPTCAAPTRSEPQLPHVEQPTPPRSLLAATVANRRFKPPPRALALARRRPCAPARPARSSVLQRRRAPRLHAIHTSSSLRNHAPPSLSHAAATTASCTQTVRGFARAAFRTARAPRSCLRQ